MPLTGIRVVELATGVAGPYCGRLLAGLGADVVKVEPAEGDRSRLMGPFPGDVPDRERSGMFLHLNTGKRSVVLDRDAQQRELELLLARADVALLGATRRELGAGDLNLDAIIERHPRLIVADVTHFGLTGPYADYLGNELVCYALSGYMMLTGSPEREPLKAYGELLHYQAGAQMALGVMAALMARRSTGRGQLVDVSVMEAGTFLLGGVEQRAYFYGDIARRNGTRLLGFPPQHSYPSTIRPCRDGFVHAHSNNRYLDLLGTLIPHPRLANPELLATMLGHADEIDAIMDQWLATRDREEIVHEAQARRLPFTEVREPGEVMAEEHHKVRGSFETVTHPGAGPLLQAGAPMRMGATPWRTLPAPMLGAQTAEVLRKAGVASPAVTAPGVRTDDAKRPLAGMRVIDFTNAVAGPIASFILADLGAEVIKVEAPTARPLVAAGTAPLKAGCEDVSYNRIMIYNELNHGKRGIALDVAKPGGRDLFLRLAAESDVVIENFAPRVMGNLGLDYERLKAVNSAIVLVSMPAFGLSGPYRDRISYGPGIDAMSGFSHLTGYADGPPMKPGNFFCDQNAGVLSAFSAIVAHWHRLKTGEGQHVELAMIEGEFQVLGDAYIDYAMNGRERRRMGNDHPEFEPHGVFPSRGADAWVAIAAETETQWQALCRVIGRDGMARDPHLATAAGRRTGRDAIRAAITEWTARRTPYEAQEVLQAAGVPAGAVVTALELLHDAHVKARGGFNYVDVPCVGPTPYPRVAFTLSETPVPIAKAAPGFAEDNDYVFGELLGLQASEITRLEAAGVIARIPAGMSH